MANPVNALLETKLYQALSTRSSVCSHAMSTSLRSQDMIGALFPWLLLLVAVCSSCFSPQRSDALSCSVEGRCPGLQVCDYDFKCRDSYSLDGGSAAVDSSLETVDASTTVVGDPDAAGLRDAAFPQAIVPVGQTTITDMLGPRFGDEFGPFLCSPGEVMYGYEGANFIAESAAGLCRLHAQCGHLETSEQGVKLIRDGATIPTSGLGAVECSSVAGVTSVTCPGDSVATGISGVLSGPSLAIAMTSFSLHCAEVSAAGAPLQSVQTKPKGPNYSIVQPEDTVSCPNGTVMVGFAGTGNSFAIGHEFVCSALEVIAE